MNQYDDMSDLERCTIKVIYRHPFYGYIIGFMRKVEDLKMPYVAGVIVKDGLMTLLHNPLLFKGMCENDGQRCFVLVHECLHPIMRHFLRQSDRNAYMIINGKPILLWNIAADIAINQLIEDEQPPWVFTYETFNLKPGLTAEQYYDALIDWAKKNDRYSESGGEQGQSGDQQQDSDGSGSDGEDGDEQKDGKSQGKQGKQGNQNGKGSGVDDKRLVDDHGGWRECASADEKDNELEAAVVRNIVSKAADHARKMGKLPGNISEVVDALLAPPKIPWQRILRRFAGDSVKVGFKYTWKRESRRFGVEQKGHATVRSIKIGVTIDTSGSISEEDFQAFIAEIRGIKNSYKTEITIIEADADVQKVYKLKRDVDTKFMGRGGTSFVPAIEYAENKLHVDLMIYLTDLCGTFPKKAPTFPVIWVGTPGSSRYAEGVPFGKFVEIKND